MKRILYICRHNSGRSIIAEAITNSVAPQDFRAYSAGLEDSGPVSDFVLDFLKEQGLQTARLKTKTIDYFTGLMSVDFDYVITTCDKATAESCPVWPGQPTCAHWDIPRPGFTPSDLDGNRELLGNLYKRIYTTVTMFTSLPEDVRQRMGVEGSISNLHEGKRPTS